MILLSTIYTQLYSNYLFVSNILLKQLLPEKNYVKKSEKINKFNYFFLLYHSLK